MSNYGERKIIIHKVNSSRHLNNLDNNYGVEIDIRANQGELVLSHDPLDEEDSPEQLVNYLKSVEERLIIANVKESGIEENLITKMKKFTNNFFLLDCEMPFIIKNYEKFGEHLSVRFSNLESIETVNNFAGKVKWLWVDTYKEIDFELLVSENINSFKKVFVSPERWDDNYDLIEFIKNIQEYKVDIDYVMTDETNAKIWCKEMFST